MARVVALVCGLVLTSAVAEPTVTELAALSELEREVLEEMAGMGMGNNELVMNLTLESSSSGEICNEICNKVSDMICHKVPTFGKEICDMLGNKLCPVLCKKIPFTLVDKLGMNTTSADVAEPTVTELAALSELEREVLEEIAGMGMGNSALVMNLTNAELVEPLTLEGPITGKFCKKLCSKLSNKICHKVPKFKLCNTLGNKLCPVLCKTIPFTLDDKLGMDTTSAEVVV